MSASLSKAAETVKEYVIISLGLLLYALAWSVFLVPNGLVGGGVTGISSIIQYSTGFNIAYSYVIINAILIIIGSRILGKGFGAKTIYAILAVALFLRILPGLIPAEFISSFAEENGKLMCVIFAGALAGFGIAMVFNQGGSSGGTDIIALMVSKYHRISPGTILLTCDLVIIASSLLIPGSGTWIERIQLVLYGYILTGVSNYTLDMVLNGRRQSVQLFVFTEHYEVLTERICNEIHRGATLLESQGGYSRQSGKLVLVIVKRTETSKILKLIKDVDPDAFVSIGNVSEVYGKGFEPMSKQ